MRDQDERWPIGSEAVFARRSFWKVTSKLTSILMVVDLDSKSECRLCDGRIRVDQNCRYFPIFSNKIPIILDVKGSIVLLTIHFILFSSY